MEIKDKIAKQAETVGKSAEEYEKTIDPRQVDYIKNDVIITKLFDFLKANNDMTYSDGTEKEKAEEKADEKAEKAEKKTVAKKTTTKSAAAKTTESAEKKPAAKKCGTKKAAAAKEADAE